MDLNQIKPDSDSEKEPYQLQAWRSQRTASIAAVISQLGHDLRQPQTAVLSNAQAALRLLGNGTDNLDEIREILNDIILDEQRASALIGEMNEKLQRDKRLRTEVRLSETIHEALDLLHDEIVGRDIQAKFSQEAGCSVMAERSQIRQVILELVSNSIEAMHGESDRPRRLDVSLEPASPDMAQIRVSDSGPGVPEGEIPKLFRPFRTTKDQALGLGLFICRSIVQAHGGTIWHQSNRDGGAAFCFTLPLFETAAQSNSNNVSGTTSTSEDSAKRLRVLLVDDSEPYRRATWSMLSSLPSLELAGEAADGLEAVKKAEELKPDLILMDISLSGINGIEAATRIRKLAPDSRIVFLSQYDDPDVVRAVLQTGALGYIFKVDSGKDLESALSAVSRGKTFLSSRLRACQ
jgi:nitrogen-specific signal transduction histidine kinase/ActR/RegA family two-component response regulator